MKRTTTATKRNGLTLIELLVVVGAVLVLIGIAIPAVRLLKSDHYLSEGARELQTLLADVQADAKANGAAAIWIEREPFAPNSSNKVFRVRVPQPYAGDVKQDLNNTNTLARVTHADVMNGIPPYVRLNRTFHFRVLPPVSIIGLGDLFQFGEKGPYFRITGLPQVDPADNTLIRIQISDVSENGNGYLPNPGSNSFTSTFRVIRIPRLAKNATPSLELPPNMFIDLSKSGFSANNPAIANIDTNSDSIIDAGVEFHVTAAEFAAAQTYAQSNNIDLRNAVRQQLGPVILTFNSSGEIDRVFSHRLGPASVPAPPTTCFFFLSRDQRVTEADQANLDIPTTAATYPNPTSYYRSLADLSNVWLTVERTGKVGVAPNAEIEQEFQIRKAADNSLQPNNLIMIDLARRLSREKREALLTE